MVIAAPRSVAPVAAFRPAATIPPIVAMTPPAVGDTELAITSLSSGTTCGSAADSEARKNRFTPSTSRYETYSGSPWLLDAISAAVRTTKPERSSADRTRICRRDQRSMNTPANGPISEYGRYKTVKAAAAAPGLGKLVALKNTYAPSPAVNMPSPACEISLVANRRRKFRSARTARRSPRKDCCAPDRRQGRRPAVTGGRRGGALAGTGGAPGQTIRHRARRAAVGSAADNPRRRLRLGRLQRRQPWLPGRGAGVSRAVGSPHHRLRPAGHCLQAGRRPVPPWSVTAAPAGGPPAGPALVSDRRGSTRPGRTGPGPPGRWRCR